MEIDWKNVEKIAAVVYHQYRLNSISVMELEDFVQDVYHRVWKSYTTGSFYKGDNGCSLDTWVFTVAYNVAKNHLNYYRQPRHAPYFNDFGRRYYHSDNETVLEGKDRDPVLLRDEYVNMIVSEDMEDTISTRNIVKKVLLRGRYTKLKDGSNKKSGFTETTLLLLKGMQYQEIADKLGVPIGTVRSRLHRAKEEFYKIQQELTGELL